MHDLQTAATTIQRVVRGHFARRVLNKLHAYQEWWLNPSETDVKYVIRVQACARRWRARSLKVDKSTNVPVHLQIMTLAKDSICVLARHFRGMNQCMHICTDIFLCQHSTQSNQHRSNMHVCYALPLQVRVPFRVQIKLLNRMARSDRLSWLKREEEDKWKMQYARRDRFVPEIVHCIPCLHFCTTFRVCTQKIFTSPLSCLHLFMHSYASLLAGYNGIRRPGSLIGNLRDILGCSAW
jgi:hypothetical protein